MPYMDLALQRTDEPGVSIDAEPAEPDPRVGATLGPYKIFECIGDGDLEWEERPEEDRGPDAARGKLEQDIGGDRADDDETDDQ